MNKADLIGKVADSTGLTKVQTSDTLDCMTSCIIDELKSGGKVTLIGFGTFSVNHRAARDGVNPSNGKPLKIPAKKVTKFKAGKALTDSLN